MSKTMLILGASGLTGYKAMELARQKFQTFGTYNLRHPPDQTLMKLDISKPESLKNIINQIKPDIVINTIALHNVDYCEVHPEQAYQVNSKAVQVLAESCNHIGARLIHISTDFVFDGYKGNYSETDSPKPLNIYAKSKLEGDFHATTCSSFAIVRPSVVYGYTPLEIDGSNSSSGKPINFALWALKRLHNNEPLQIVNDQFASPTLADTLAAVMIRLASKAKNDLYHVSGTNVLSRYDFTVKIANIMGYASETIKPIESELFNQIAKRPRDSSLNCAKVQTGLNYKLPNVDESLAVMRSQIELESPGLLGGGY
jgi:dTDP-4-dehydrorhamnose reductase